ncbi:MAG TPA: hypothetical protein VFI20_10765 [Terracidiphilus sp.]|nr:hypothetical protein [Terracidiphilus sp.]
MRSQRGRPSSVRSLYVPLKLRLTSERHILIVSLEQLRHSPGIVKDEAMVLDSHDNIVPIEFRNRGD